MYEISNDRYDEAVRGDGQLEKSEEFDAAKQDILREIANIGAGHASSALSMLLESPVKQDVPEVKLVPLDALTEMLGGAERVVVSVAMSIRMLPISTVFQKMRRLVRDVSKKVDKEVELVLIGEETEVDKNVIDSLADPLMHIIRNSIDHGIGTPEERIKAGKPEKGRIVLEARTTGSDVIVTVSDDGRGLQRDKILKKAREKGLLSKPESELSDKEVYSLIFLPGFSTKDSVTEFSGRGVGMDVVRRNINQIGGSVSVESEPGKGTTHIIRIPLTLTIVDGMRFSTGNINFIVPIVSVKTAMEPKPNDVFLDPEGNEMIMNTDYVVLFVDFRLSQYRPFLQKSKRVLHTALFCLHFSRRVLF